MNDYCNKASSILGIYWKDLNGDEILDNFESNWTKWKVEDVVKWFKFTLASKDDMKFEDSSDSDDESDDDSSTDDNDDQDTDEKKDVDSSNTQVHKMSDDKEIDYEFVTKQLLLADFHSKTYFPLIQKGVQFKPYGFKNKSDCNLLCKSTQKLLKKYPKRSRNKKKEKKKTKQQEIEIEGNVDDTGYMD